MAQPLVSVVVPIYNAEEHLGRCIESVINQTYTNLEIILVDDGSVDKSASICDLWSKKDSRITVIHKENSGAGMARNAGLDIACGQYVLFVDSDDYIYLETVEKCVEGKRNNDVDIIMFVRPKTVCDDLQPKPLPPERFSKDRVMNSILPGLFVYGRRLGISVWGKMFNMDIIREHNIRFCSERELWSEDGIFILEYFAHVSSALIIQEKLYHYTRGENSLSKRYIHGRQALNDAFLNKSLELCGTYKYPESVKRCIKVRYHMYTISGMKQTVKSTLSLKEKYKELRTAFKSPALRSTITEDVLKLENRSKRMFWRFYKLRMFFVCYFLIWYKAHR